MTSAARQKQFVKGGAFAFMDPRHDRLLRERIAAVRAAKAAKSHRQPTADCHLTKDELDVVLEPMSEWSRFLTGQQAEAAFSGMDTRIVSGDEDSEDEVETYNGTYCVGAGINRLTEGYFECRPYIDGRRIYCGRYLNYDDALAAARAAKRGETVDGSFPGRLKMGQLHTERRVLSDDEVRAIRKLHGQGWSLKRLAEHFRRGTSRIHAIVIFKNYRHVVDEDSSDEADGHRPDDSGAGRGPDG